MSMDVNRDNSEMLKLRSVCDRKENSGRNRIAIIWPEPEPDRHPTKLAGLLTEFGISSSVVLSNTIICNFHSTISN